MSRPRNTTPSVEVHVMLPVDTVARVNLLLFSELQGRVPLGHLAKFFDRAAKDLLEKLELEAAQHQETQNASMQV